MFLSIPELVNGDDDQCWTYDGSKLSNKAGIWKDVAVTLPSPNTAGIIRKIDNNLVFGVMNDLSVKGTEIIEEVFAQNDIGQIWFRGNDNTDGCFTLQHLDDSGLFLTAIDSNRLELHGNFLF